MLFLVPLRFRSHPTQILVSSEGHLVSGLDLFIQIIKFRVLQYPHFGNLFCKEKEGAVYAFFLLISRSGPHTSSYGQKDLSSHNSHS
mgnify:FL=1